MISHKHKAIFLHIGKTAGTSIESAILPDVHPIKDFNKEVMMGFLPQKGYAQHFTIKQMMEFYPHEMQSYFTFTFIRNPYDRLLSVFKYNRKGYNGDIDLFFNKLSKGKIKSGSHLTPQHEYTHLEGNQNVDMIGRFENLAFDFQKISTILNINKALPHLTKSTFKGEVSLKGWHKEVINEVYSLDFELLKYHKEKI